MQLITLLWTAQAFDGNTDRKWSDYGKSWTWLSFLYLYVGSNFAELWFTNGCCDIVPFMIYTDFGHQSISAKTGATAYTCQETSEKFTKVINCYGMVSSWKTRIKTPSRLWTMGKRVQSTHLTEAALSASRKKRLPFLFEATVPLVQVIGPAARELKNCHHFALYKSKVECNPHEIKVQSIKVRFGPIVGMRIRLGVMLVCKNELSIGKEYAAVSFTTSKQSKNDARQWQSWI